MIIATTPAKLSQLKAGDTIHTDTGFTCTDTSTHTVESHQGRLWFRCNHGEHYLDGQLDTDGDTLVGVFVK